MGTINNSNQGRIRIKRYKNWLSSTPFSVTYFTNGIARLNQISDISIEMHPAKPINTLLKM